MPTPFIPDINPEIDVDRDKAIDLLLTSIALEEISLAHIIKAEAEKIQFVLGTDDDKAKENDEQESKEKASVEELLEINKSVEYMLRKVIKKEMLLGFQLEDIIELLKMKEEEKEDDE